MKHVVIVGAGFCGVALMARLAGRVRVTIVDSRPPGGPAYGTNNDLALRLNVPAERMSLMPEAPRDFVHFLEARGRPTGGFVPRRWYAEYLGWHFDRALSRGVQHRQADVVDVIAQGASFEVVLATEERLSATEVVLATGNAAPTVPASFVGQKGVIAEPWSEAALSGLDVNARVLVLGSGLTALDVLVMLGRRGHRDVLVVSPTGRWPLPHLAPTPQRREVVDTSSLPLTLRGVVRWAREHSKHAPWQLVVDALRLEAPRVWASLGEVERRRLLRVGLLLWNLHRHRAPLDLLAEVNAGAARLIKGRIASVVPEGAALAINITTGQALTRHVRDAVIICTGPSLRTALLSKLETRGLVRFAPRDFGVEPLVPHLQVLGSLRRWQVFESTAVPELAVQVERLASAMLAEGDNWRPGRLPENE